MGSIALNSVVRPCHNKNQSGKEREMRVGTQDSRFQPLHLKGDKGIPMPWVDTPAGLSTFSHSFLIK